MGAEISKKLMINVHDSCAQSKMYHHIINLLEQQQELYNRKIILLCIGSDRYIGDALGPLVGSYLEEHTNCLIHGSLDHPVHAGNLIEVIEGIYQQKERPIVIAIDACLGNHNEIGNIEIWEGGLEAGIAVGTRLPCVGDISIIGVVNGSGRIGYLDLQSTPLSIVMKLSRLIGGALRDAMNVIHIHHVV
ncbi:spore protease YyaC [Pelosinus sp. sgz500959]|uniref:spore protease YyaC n=1 Tax=Pelosinus sp. sgz500959 TaxID=3242472 RepID=UPI003671CCA3